jgi:urocanate hydratase
MTERAEDLQFEALRAYTFLSSFRQDWGGALIVGCGLGPGGAALSIAGNMAGAGCLAIEEQADVCRAAVRSGACDFVVNTVDEALRILKNEIRKRQPVSVALSMNEAAALNELVERGVQPELFAAFGESAPIAEDAALRFGALGAVIAKFDQGSGAGVDVDAKLEEFTAPHGLSPAALLFPDGEQLRITDAELFQIIPPDDRRRRWLAAAARFFHRERPHRRVMYLTSAEREKLGV